MGLLCHLPNEIIVRILEHVCTLIIEDLNDITPHIKRAVTRSSVLKNEWQFGRRLKQFLHLLLVCRSFHNLVIDQVRVNSTPIRTKLLDLQMSKFMNILELSNVVSKTCNGRDQWGGIALRDIPEICGLVWHNPTFPTRNTFFGVFLNEGGLERDGIEWFAYLAPKLCKDGVFKTECKESKHGSRDFNKLVYKKKYRISPEFRYRTFNFVVGKYRFGTTIDDTWGGVSILSFKSNKFDLRGDEGRYWLWLFCSPWTYFIIDYEELVVLGPHDRGNGIKLDLKRLGLRLLD